MKTQSFSLQKYVRSTNSSGYSNGTTTAAGTYNVKNRYPGSLLRHPSNTYPFTGEVMLLTSGGTASAASELAALAFSNKRAIIIGEETGGCYYGATGGDFLNFELPESKIKERIPAILIRLATDSTLGIPFGLGVLPHYEVVPDINAILNQQDRPLQLALRLAKQYHYIPQLLQ